MSDQAQLVVTTRTQEGRHVSELMPRPQAEALLAVLERLITDPNQVGPPATVRFRTFGPIGRQGGEVLLTGDAILAVELIDATPRRRGYQPARRIL